MGTVFVSSTIFCFSVVFLLEIVAAAGGNMIFKHLPKLHEASAYL